MRRRDFIASVGASVAAGSVGARAQQLKTAVRRVGLLIGANKTDTFAQLSVAAFQLELSKLGWAVSSNLLLEDHWASGDTPAIQPYAADLVRTEPDVILVSGPGALNALKASTSTIPIVFVSVSDPVGQGFVASFPHPAGNITGFTSFDFSRLGKLMEVLKEAAPQLARIGFLYSPNNPNAVKYLNAVRKPAATLAVELLPLSVTNTGEIENAVNAVAAAGNGGLVVPPNYITSINRELIFSLTAHNRVPTIYPEREYATTGGLLAYGPNRTDIYRRAASYVDRILRGERVGELPVQQPTVFELVINVRAAKAIGLPIPPMLLARADTVIE